MSRIVGISKVEKAVEERQAITGLVIDPQFLRQIRPITNLDYFKSPFARTIAGWCLDYWDQYEEAPGIHIEDVFNAKQRNDEIDEDEAKLISKFLESLSTEYERTEKRSTEYLARSTEKYFRRRAVEILREDMAQHLAAGEVEQAEEILATFKSPQRGGATYTNPFTDEDTIREAFEHSVQPLFKLPGALGEAWNDNLVRDAFIGIMGPEKRGKTWWLMYFSRMAARGGCNVAFFAVGDMTKPQMTIRYHIMNNRRSNRAKYCGKMLIPVLDCLHNQTGECDRRERKNSGDIIKTPGKDGKPATYMTFDEIPDWEPCLECYRDKEIKKNWKGAAWYKEKEKTEPLNWREAFKTGVEFDKKFLSNKGFRLECHSRGAINVKGIKTILSTWEANDGFVPDVVVIDYADNLGPEDTRKEFRQQQNDSWGAMRSLSQEKNCLVITATQADAASYGRKTLREDNFSEDKRKYSHVTAIATLNQDHKEKQAGIMRLGQMFLREEDFDTSKTVTVLQSIATGQPVLASFWS